MPGKYCNGKPTQTPFVQESKAFSDGMYYRTTGTGAERPITNNPFPTWDTQNREAWNNGWNAADGVAGSTITRAVAECTAWAGLAVPT